jgi:hypothetical protein
MRWRKKLSRMRLSVLLLLNQTSPITTPSSVMAIAVLVLNEVLKVCYLFLGGVLSKELIPTSNLENVRTIQENR